MGKQFDFNEIIKLQAVLYSFEQKAFHVETLGDYIKSNVVSTRDKKDHQYRLIAVCADYPAASTLIENLRLKYKW